jgi:6-phosphofructo-2-kinase
MIDVGRKIVSHQIHGFLAAQAVYYLVNFNLSPRQIWITRHGESIDNLCGRIGGNSELSEGGRRYARALARFMAHQREIWTVKQQQKAAVSGLMLPRPGDGTPPYTLSTDAAAADKNFCVWTSMLKRSVQSAEWFDEDEFDVKQMRMLDELSVGNLDGMTYDEIRTKYADEYEQRKRDRLHYRYPGSGESYLDLVHRLQPVIVEVERMTDHVLLLCHRSVSRVLLAYFLGLNREAITDVDVPLGVVYMLEPVSFLCLVFIVPSTIFYILRAEFPFHRFSSKTD